MNQEVKKLAMKQYLHYFRFWFILTGIVLVATIGLFTAKTIAKNRPRGNDVSSTERVFDYADVLTDKEEEDLRAYISRCEQNAHIDIVVVTVNEYMGVSDNAWETAMMNYADDFYDNGVYGWNKPYGDGALILDNWYEDAEGSQKGTWISTSGKMEDTIGYYEENAVLDDIYYYIDSNPYKAYYDGVAKLAFYGEHGYGYDGTANATPFCCAAILPFIIALIYATSHLKQAPAKDTTMASTYLVAGSKAMRNSADAFIRKNVTSHRIESSSSGSRSGGSHHSGGGSHGSHHSSGGHSHGGGGRRR